MFPSMLYNLIFTHLIADILRKFDNLVEVILPQLPSFVEPSSDPEGRVALIWILGEYGEVQSTCTIHITNALRF